MLLDFSREVSAFVASGKNREVVLFTPGPHARQHCQTYGLATDPIPLRLIPVKLKNGAIEVLATSLLGEKTYPSTCFKHPQPHCDPFLGPSSHRRSLYHDRQHTYRVNFAQAPSNRISRYARNDSQQNRMKWSTRWHSQLSRVITKTKNVTQASRLLNAG